MSPITYDEYSFSMEPDPELEQLIETFHHIFNNGSVHEDVMSVWTLDRPGGYLEILPPKSPDDGVVGVLRRYPWEDRDTAEDIGDFLYRFRQWFYYNFDGYNLFFSRFPAVPAALERGGSAMLGILLGYHLPDVAQHAMNNDTPFRSKRDWSGD